MSTEAAQHARFDLIRYAQVWEDADVLIEGLDIQPGDTCLSIASAGDNALAMLTRSPARVIAVDLSPAQIACLKLRMAMYRCLTHAQFLQLMGSRACEVPERLRLYEMCESQLDIECRHFWQSRRPLIGRGIAAIGKFENYFRVFRQYVLPLVHHPDTVMSLLTPREPATRVQFYQSHWNTWRWRLLFRVFFSRWIMGRMGRDPAFFRYVEGSVADRIMQRAQHALTKLNPAANPYLHWILTGTHGATLPLALRLEHYQTIKANLDRIDIRLATLEQVIDSLPPRTVHRFNLSDIFEYMSPQHYENLLTACARVAVPGGRLLYWNMLAPRHRPDHMSELLKPLTQLADQLHLRDQAFFYSRVILEEILP